MKQVSDKVNMYQQCMNSELQLTNTSYGKSAAGKRYFSWSIIFVKLYISYMMPASQRRI